MTTKTTPLLTCIGCRETTVFLAYPPFCNETCAAETAAHEYDALRRLEATAKGEHDDTPSLYVVRWLRTLLDWCRDNGFVQHAISVDEDPSAIMEHFTVVRMMTDSMIGALSELDKLREQKP